MKFLTPPNPSPLTEEQKEVLTNRPLLKIKPGFLKPGILPILIGFALFMLTPVFQNTLSAQCSPCEPGNVQNENSDPWSGDCYLNASCLPQGNPCTANDVTLTGIFIADSMGNPVGACSIGDPVTVLLWGNFANNTGTNRYAVRTNTQVWINNACNVELNSCSFDVLAAGTSAQALVGTFTYICGQTVELRRTWIGWSTSAAQCSNPGGPNYNDVCGEYSPSKCSREFDILEFLAPNFSYDCGEFTETTTEVCFTDLTMGGIPPLSYSWDFGDGGMSTLVNPCHTYNASSGEFTVELTVTDSSGTMAGAFLVINLDSLECCMMTAICPPTDGGFFTCIEDVPAADTTLVTITDSCGPVQFTVHEEMEGTGCRLDTMTLTRRYIFSDGSNLDTCIQIFTIVDDLPPVITECPGNVTVQCTSLIPPSDESLVTASDNCPGNIVTTFVGDVISGQTCANRYTITRTYRVFDNCLNSATCAQTITVFDNTGPTINCPAPVSVQCADDVPAPTPGSITSTDNCGGTATVTHQGDAVSNMTCSDRFTLIRTYRATDACGNTSTCNQIITVNDNTPPVITACPLSLVVQCALDVPDALSYGSVLATDNCDDQLTFSFGGEMVTNFVCVNAFTLTRTWIATDNCGNSSTCTYTVAVFDNTPLSIIGCLANVSVQCANLLPAPSTAGIETFDNCLGTPVVNFAGDVISGQTCANRFTVTRTYQAMDECGNSASCTQTLTVFDNTVPTITCPGPVTVQCANQVPTPAPGSVTSSDNCGGSATVTHGGDVISNQTCANRYTVTRTYNATDACGNSSSCTQTITVLDNTAPSVTCPLPVSVQCAALVPAPAPGSVTSSDNCGGSATITHGGDVISNQTCANRYTVTRTYNATDACGNSSSCTQIITVFDNTAPSITCPLPVSVQCAGDIPLPAPTSITTSDNCGGTATVTHDGDVNSNMTCTNRFTVIRTYRATDACGNTATCNQTITVFDNTPPTIENCPGSVTVQCASLVPPASIDGITSSDNCLGTPTIIHAGDAISGQTCTNRYTVTRTYRATDACGNSSSCTQTISVFDDTAPTLTCPLPLTVQCANLVPTPAPGSVTATDNCGGTASISFVNDAISNQVCANRYNVTRTYRATDECGNSATCTQTITVFDNTPPTVTCPTMGGGTVQCASLVPAPNTELVTATDNCGGGATITHAGDVISNQTCTNRYTVTRTYLATDACGNSASCTQTLTVFDNTGPSITCPENVSVQCATLVPVPSTTAVIATDNCGGATTVTYIGDVISNQTCTNRYSIARTYRATDECGNSSSCTQTITVFDDTPPGIVCPQNLLFQCANEVPTANPAQITATDNCGGTASVTFVSDVISNQTCTNRFNITRTYRATDVCGNSATCTQTISVFDNTAPTLTCPLPLSVQCANLVPTPAPGSITATDNCGGTASVTFVSDLISNQVCANRYSITRTYRATDECGNSGSCSQTITVFDNTPPTVTCPTMGVSTVQCASLVPAPNTELVTATDNCGGGATITHAGDVISNQTCTNRYTVTRTYLATDACGNSASCTQTLTVYDDTAPSITCPENVSVQCASLVPAPNTTGIVATDNCGGTASVTYIGDVVSNQTCTNRYSIARTYRATDECGNSASCTQTITVFDDTAPSITCPINVSVQCANLVPQPSTTAVVSTDNCGGVATVTHIGDVISGQTCANRYSIARTYRATDECGNSASCTQTITVFDDTAPTLTCPLPVTVQCASLVPQPAPGSITATDNCGGTASVTFVNDAISGQTCLNRYTVTRTYRATDECGNSASCTQIISVFDDTAPTLTCPLPVSVQCANLVPQPAPGSITATDNCGGTASVTFVSDAISNQVCANRYNITRTYRATDECGNSASCSQTITVFDNTPPTVTCPTMGGGTVQCASEVPAPNTELVTATDNCGGGATITHAGDVISNQTCANRYNVIRTYVATDECGNSASCTQTLTVFDSTPPEVTCPIMEGGTVQCANEVPDPDPALVTATDNCGGTVTVTHVGDEITNMTCTNRFNVVRTYRATDECGNSASCTQTLVVYDDIPPAIVCPDDVTIECDDNTSPDVLGVATATDNCNSIPEITSSDVTVEGSCPQEYTILRTWTATDECTNSSSCTQTIEIEDTTPPSVVCPTGVTVQCAGVLPEPNTESVTATDNCGIARVEFVGDEIVNQTCTNRYNVNRTYQATDECGNSASCSQTFVVFDDTAPTLTCPATVSVQCATDVPTPNIEGVTATDNCGGETTIAHVSDVISGQVCANRYNVTRTYSATDECGNSASCSQIITVFDNTPPAVTCPTMGGGTVQCANEIPAPNIQLVTATDNCGSGATITHVGDVMTNVVCSNRFNVVRTYRATDACGNSASCTQTLTVFDNTPPAVTCPPAGGSTVQCANQVPAPNPALVTATDNCGGGTTITHAGDVITNMTCANRFNVVRTYRATDACGNSSSCTQTITVLDNTAPTITCPASVSVQCANQVPAVNPASVTTSENCAGTATVTHLGDVISGQICANKFVVTRTYRATDACGNSASCSQTITVFDNTAPTITCAPNVSVQCASQVPPANPANVTASDNCGGTATVTVIGDVISNMTCANRFRVTRTYRATDACGNSASCSQTITVFDNTAPVITFTDPLLEGIPNGGTLEVACFGQDPEWDFPTFGPGSVNATDNCGGAVNLTYSSVFQDGGNCIVDGYIILYHLTWTATDVCGNSSTAHVFVALVDEIPPVIHGVPDDITVSCDEIPEPDSLVFATDECLCACIVLFEEDGPDPGCQDGQVITRTWTAHDDCGNVTEETQTITLIDNDPPQILFTVPELVGLPDGSVLEFTCQEGGLLELFDDLDAGSVISPVSCGSAGTITFESETHVANNCEFWGYVEQRTFTWTAVDLCGNESELTLIARLIDTDPPILLNVPEMTCVGDPSLAEIDAIDNCGEASIQFFDVQIPNPCGPGNAPAIRRTYEAFDDCGNFAVDTAILIPNDHAHPTMEFVNPILAELEFGEILIIDCEGEDGGNYTDFGPDDVAFTDDCMFGVTVVFTEKVIESRDCSTGGILAVVELRWDATDICGNVGEALIIAHIVDQTSPQLLDFDPEVTIGCNDSLPETQATDNCGTVTVTYQDVIVTGPCQYEYDVMRKVIAADPCGNMTSALQLVHVGDGSGPTIEGVVPEVCDDLTLPNVTAFDECAGVFVEVTMTSEVLNSNCVDGFVIRRTWSATDICGNVSSVTQDVIVGDTTAPVILVPSNSIINRYLDILGPHLVLSSQTQVLDMLDDLDDGSVFVIDDCDQQIIPQFTLDISFSANCLLDGFYEHRVYSWIATDACGNADSISFFVNILPDSGPELLGVPFDETVICRDLPAPPIVTPANTDIPIIIEFFETIEPGDGPGVFVVIRRWVARDPCGNETIVTQSILWIPDSLLDCDIVLPEMVECNSHGVVIGSDVSGGQGELDYEWEIIGEKCFIQSGQNTPEIIIYVGWSTVQIRLTVTDEFGCSNVCSATLDCVDSALDPLTGLPISTSPETVQIPGVDVHQAGEQPTGYYLTHMNLWPNPANGNLSLSFESYVNQEVEFTLTNLLGQVVLTDEIDAVKGFNSRKFDVSLIPEGSYLMQVKSQRDMYTEVVVVVHNK